MLRHELTYLVTESIGQRLCSHRKERIGRDIVRDTQQPLLHTALGIFKTEIECCSFPRSQVPKSFTLGNADAKIQHQPGLADFRCAAEDGHALGQKRLDTEPRGRQPHVH